MKTEIKGVRFSDILGHVARPLKIIEMFRIIIIETSKKVYRRRGEYKGNIVISL